MDKIFSNTNEVIQDRRNTYIRALSSRFATEEFEYNPELPKKEDGDVQEATQADDYGKRLTEIIEQLLETHRPVHTSHPLLDRYGIGSLGDAQNNAFNFVNQNLDDFKTHTQQGDKMFRGLNFLLADSANKENLEKYDKFMKENNLQAGQWLNQEQQEEISQKLADVFGENVIQPAFYNRDQFLNANNQGIRDYIVGSLLDAVPTFRLPESQKTLLADNNLYFAPNLGDYNQATNSVNPQFRNLNMNNKLTYK